MSLWPVLGIACAPGATDVGPEWMPEATDGSSSDDTAGSSATRGSTSTSASDASATADPTVGPDCYADDDCAVGSCIDGVCQDGSDTGPMCLAATEPCNDASECCGDLLCDSTSLGQTCCGWEGEPCSTANGEDCCGNLLCVDGACGYSVSNSCQSPCSNDQPPALRIEALRLANIGGSLLGICGDANHTYGYHVPAALLPSSDYSLEGSLNDPVCDWHAAAIDIGMDWPASRDWLEWLIIQIQTDAIQGVAEVIGSYDGVNVRYWSDSTGWSTEGIEYSGTGHDTWSHVAVYRSTTLQDHGILLGWTATDGP